MRATCKAKKATVLLFSLAVLLAGGAAAVRGQSALDGFDPHANNTVRVVVVQPDGKILLGGDFTTVLGVVRNRIARLNPDGTLDSAFNPNANATVWSIAVQADGKILVGGTFNGASSIGGQMRNHIARLDATTGLADSFDPNANADVRSIAVQADGKILAGGGFNGFSSIGGQTRNYIARLDATTGLADSFDPNANATVISIAVQADGKILAGGFFTSIGAQTRNYIARLDATTGAADSFNPSADNDVLSIAVQADGKILAGGDFASIGGQPRNYIARLETDGRLDQTLNLSTVGNFVYATAVQPDGKMLIGGSFTTVLGVARNNIARLSTDGTLDTTFNPNADNQVNAIAVQADGKILAGGVFTSIGGQPRNYIARLDATTGVADLFNPNANSDVYAIAVQADGKILAGGLFTSIGGQTRNYIARLDATTGAADLFDPNADNDVVSIAVQADGKILASGGFIGIGGQPRNRIARLDATTGLADSFDPSANSDVASIVVQADGKILAGGYFTSIGGQPRNYIARLDATTGLADSFNPNATGTVYAIAVQADGKILAGGFFLNIGGQFRNRIARLDATTGLADLFDPSANNTVLSIAVQADGKILAGGAFTSIGGQTRNLFARLSNDTGALQNLAVTQTAITWTRGGSSPQFTRVTFESSTDNVNYTPLGNGTATGSNWTLTGLNFSTGQNFYIRARGYYRSGLSNGSESITESVRNAFVAVPTVTSISPASATAGGGAFTLTVNGSGFITTSVVNWNGAPRATTFSSSAQLTAAISAADIATAGTISVTVTNPGPGGGTSNAMTFSVNNPVPAISSISPSSATADGPAFTLTVNGSHFVSGSKVHWNSSVLTTTFVSSTRLTATVPESDIETAGTALVRVVNAPPGGGTSNAMTFTVNNPTPTPTPIPAVTTNPATNVASFSVTLNGSLNPRESTTTVYFQYGQTTSYGFTTPVQTQTGNTLRPISANISGLLASHLYHFRIVAHNAGGTSFGSDRTFTTLSAIGPPVVTTSPATLIASFSATLNGSVDPHELATTVHFQYGATTSYGFTTAAQSQAGSTYRNISANISGLNASTIYHFRIVAHNGGGTSFGSDRTFTTLSATGPPVVTTSPATLIASFSATLNGSLDPHGLTTAVHFQYGTTTSYGFTTTAQSQTGSTYRNISANISGLNASTIYHVRIVATNSDGIRYGSDSTFTTLTATGPPVVTTNPATDVDTSSATLNGSLDPHGLTTTVHFQYGTTTSYGHTTPMQSQTGNTYRNIAANISGLTTDTTYHFRIVATNSAGTRLGSDRTFTTP